jgi:hypothetical protein
MHSYSKFVDVLEGILMSPICPVGCKYVGPISLWELFGNLHSVIVLNSYVPMIGEFRFDFK